MAEVAESDPDLMVTSGFPPAERDEQSFEVKDPGREDTFKGPQGYLLRSVSNELVNAAGFEEEIKSAAADRHHDRPPFAEAAIDAAESLPEDRARTCGRIDFLDNETGGIRAMYGGEDHLRTV